MNRKHHWAGWVFRILLALGFLAAGAGKFFPQAALLFRHWGYPAYVQYVVATLECLAGLLVLVPRTFNAATVLIALLLAGAVITHLVHDPAVELVRPAIFLLLLLGARRFNRLSPP